jgi:hypothetical protein
MQFLDIKDRQYPSRAILCSENICLDLSKAKGKRHNAFACSLDI